MIWGRWFERSRWVLGMLCVQGAFATFAFSTSGWAEEVRGDIAREILLNELLEGEVESVEGEGDGKFRRDLDLPTLPEEAVSAAEAAPKSDEYFEGRTLRHLLSGAREKAFSGGLAPMIDYLSGLRLVRGEKSLYITVRYAKSFSLPIVPRDKVAQGQVYEIHVPRVSRFAITLQDGRMRIEQLDLGIDGWQFKVKLPLVPVTVYVNGASVDLVSGEIVFGAGFVANMIDVLVHAKLQESDVKFDRVSLGGVLK